RVMQQMAQDQFQEAETSLAHAIGLLDARLSEPAVTPAERADLLQARADAQLAIGIALYGRTKVGDPARQTAQRSQLAARAIERFQSVGADGAAGQYWEARAWTARCHLDQGLPQARDELNAVLDARGPEAAAGRRLAGYFRLFVPAEDPRADGLAAK